MNPTDTTTTDRAAALNEVIDALDDPEIVAAALQAKRARDAARIEAARLAAEARANSTMDKTRAAWDAEAAELRPLVDDFCKRRRPELAAELTRALESVGTAILALDAEGEAQRQHVLRLDQIDRKRPGDSEHTHEVTAVIVCEAERRAAAATGVPIAARLDRVAHVYDRTNLRGDQFFASAR